MIPFTYNSTLFSHDDPLYYDCILIDKQFKENADGRVSFKLSPQIQVETKASTSEAEVYLAASSVDKAMAAFEAEGMTLFQFIAGYKCRDNRSYRYGGDLLIYADPVATIELLVGTWKAMFPNATSENLWFLYQHTLINTLYGELKASLYTRTPQKFPNDPKGYYISDKETFLELCNNRGPFDIDRDLAYRLLPTDMKILSYLANKQNGEILHKELLDFIWHEFNIEQFDFKKQVRLNYLNLHLMYPETFKGKEAWSMTTEELNEAMKEIFGDLVGYLENNDYIRQGSAERFANIDTDKCILLWGDYRARKLEYLAKNNIVPEIPTPENAVCKLEAFLLKNKEPTLEAILDFLLNQWPTKWPFYFYILKKDPLLAEPFLWN